MTDYVQAVLANVQQPPVVAGADEAAVAWEVVLKATGTKLDATVTEHDIEGVMVYRVLAGRRSKDPAGCLCRSMPSRSRPRTKLGLKDEDTLILRGDKVEDSTTLTLAPRLQKNLVLLERVAREVSL